MKIKAMHDMELMIVSAIKTSDEEIGNTINGAKIAALSDINTEYDALIKVLGEYDMTKEDLDKETRVAIKKMHDAKLLGGRSKSRYERGNHQKYYP